MLVYSKRMVNEVYDHFGMKEMIRTGINFDTFGHPARPATIQDAC